MSNGVSRKAADEETDSSRRLKLEREILVLNDAWTAAAWHRLRTECKLAVGVTIHEWDLEKQEVSALVIPRGQTVLYGLTEHGEKSFILGPSSKKDTLTLKPGHSFFVEIDVCFAGNREHAGACNFRALPGTHWKQSEFDVIDTLQPTAGAGWRVKLHFEEPLSPLAPTTNRRGGGGASAACGNRLAAVSVVHDPTQHTEAIDRLLYNALEHERQAMMTLLMAAERSLRNEPLPVAWPGHAGAKRARCCPPTADDDGDHDEDESDEDE